MSENQNDESSIRRSTNADEDAYSAVEIGENESIGNNENKEELKQHFVSPSTTKVNVSGMIINDEIGDEIQVENYISCAEKRARLGSISDSSSTCSSSPFELCDVDVHEGDVVVVEHAIVETPSNSGSNKLETCLGNIESTILYLSLIHI